MAINNFHRTVFAICLTALIFAAVVGVLCFIHRRESRRLCPAEKGHAEGIVTPKTPDTKVSHAQRRAGNDFRGSDETSTVPVSKEIERAGNR